MEEKIKQANPTLHRYLFTVTTFSKILAMILFIALPFLGFYLGMQYQQKLTVSTPVISRVQNNTISTFKTVPTTQPSLISASNETGKTHPINLSSIDSKNPNAAYWKAQVFAPSNYYATDDEMLDSYDSQGGMAPPRLILMKNHQVVFNEDYFKEISSGNNDCIMIWSTGGFSSIDEWTNNILNNNGSLSNKESLTIDNRIATIYLLSGNNNKIFVGFLPVSNTNGRVSYFFNTCNTNNKSNFIDIIKSIKFTGDLKLGAN
jgi:hypothetical protein